MTAQTEADGQPVPIRFETIRQYADANIPIRPIKADGKPDVSNLFMEGEADKILCELPNTLKEWVCEDGKIHPLKLLTAQPLTPKEFWTDERITRQKWFGIECQTGFNASLSAIIIGIDADDEKPKAIVQEIITRYELVSKTIVQNTPHNGLHLLVKIPCKCRKRALYLNLCKDDCHIEIKTTTMGITLAPSRHRKDKHLSYIQEGRYSSR